MFSWGFSLKTRDTRGGSLIREKFHLPFVLVYQTVLRRLLSTLLIAQVVLPPLFLLLFEPFVPEWPTVRLTAYYSPADSKAMRLAPAFFASSMTLSTALNESEPYAWT